MTPLNTTFKNNYQFSLKLCLLALIVFALFAFITGYKERLETFMVIMQITIGLCFIIFLSVSPYLINIKQLIFCIFGYNLFFSVIFRILFIEYYGTEYGLAVDSYTYDYVAEKSLTLNFPDVIKYLSSFWDIDDWGYSLYTIIGFKFFGPELGRWIILFSNSVLITISSILLYRLCLNIFRIKKIATAACAMWGFFPFLFITASVGLKENVLCFIIVSFWYFSYKYFLDKKYKSSLFIALILALLTFTFRKAICLMLLISLLLMMILNRKNSKTLRLVIILCGCIAPLVGAYVIEVFTGLSLEQVLAVTESRNSSMNSSVSGPIVQSLAACLGPFPNFNRLVEYGLYHSIGLLFKSIISIFALIGICRIYKEDKYIFYPIALYYIFGLFMLVLGGVALDMRYAVTFYMAFIILSCYGFLSIKSSFITYSLQLIVLSIICVYNNR